MRTKIDTNHSVDAVIRRSMNSFIFCTNYDPIAWFIKKYNSAESSAFGSEFMAMKDCAEYSRGFNFFADDGDVLRSTVVICSTAKPGSTLKNKIHSVAYHLVRKGVSRDEWRTAYLNKN